MKVLTFIQTSSCLLYLQNLQLYRITILLLLLLHVTEDLGKSIARSGENPLISANDLKKIQSIIDTTPPPSDIGRIPLKIAFHFAGFSADQGT